MALPPRAAAVLVKLYDAPSATAKPQGILADFQTTGTDSPKQTDFYSNQWWYKDWPDEVIVKTHASGAGEVVVGISYVSPLAYESVYPDNIVVDYDPTYTKISCDASGSYFDVYMNGLQPERYYKLLFKTVLATGGTVISDNNYYFKVIR